jgi:cobalamin biosynthetic protein CobC
MKHGGDLVAAEAAFGRPRDGWLDLSTGVNPHAYALPPFPPDSLTRLPSQADLDALIDAARAAYGWRPETRVVAGPGTQAMIQLLPYLRVRGTVAVVGPTYSEHAYVWARAGHDVWHVDTINDGRDAQVVIVVNPDNPTGQTTPRVVLRTLADKLAERGGLLVVDEAFADVTPDLAFGRKADRPGLVVLRSFGKFFGLPGVRLGFAAGDEEMIAELEGELGPWPVSGPAIAAGRLALSDEAWIATMRLRLAVDALRLERILIEAGLSVVGGCDLFRLAQHERADEIHASLARAGVLCRLFEERPGELRFGLPPDDAGYNRLEAALASVLQAAH